MGTTLVQLLPKICCLISLEHATSIDMGKAKNDDKQIGLILEKAESTLKLLGDNKYPLVKDLLFGVSFDFRVITDRLPFEQATPASSVNEEELLASESVGIIRCENEGSYRFGIFCEKEIPEKAALLMSHSLYSILRATHQALGIDLSYKKPEFSK